MGDRSRERLRHKAVLLGLAGLLACAPEPVPEEPEPVERAWPAAELHAEGRVVMELAPGEIHRWRLPLDAGDFVRLVVEQDGVDVELTWRDPAGEEVLTADRNINDRGPELVMAVAETAGEHTLAIQALPGFSGGRYEATMEALRPAEEADRLAARTYRRFRQAEELPRTEARAIWNEALDVWRDLDEATLEGEVLYRLGFDHYVHGESARAVEALRRAADALGRAGRRRWEAMARSGVAVNLERSGEPEAAEQAVEEHRIVRATAREVGDPLLEAKALNSLGRAYRSWGEVQESLASYEAALALLPKDNVTLRPNVLHNLGVLHSLYFEDHPRGIELLTAARDAWSPRDPSYERHQATTSNQLGRVALERGDLDEARSHFEAALELRGEEDPCGRALTLARLALIAEAGGRTDQADSQRLEALAQVREESCPRNEPTVRILAAELAEARGDLGAALEDLTAARRLAEARQDRTVSAEALFRIARVHRARGDLEAALEVSRQALERTQGVRPTVLREDLRTAFFATVQERFDLHVGILTDLARHREAWSTAETARAQALQDLLAEAGTGLRRVADPDLVERERRLRRRLSYAASRPEPRPGEVDAWVEDLERVRAEIRAGNPRYAELTRPRPLTVDGVQRDLLDDESWLLEYRLGDEGSWLWIVGSDSFSAHSLPPRAEIEPLAREAAGWLRSLEWPGENPPVLCELSRKLLGPAVGALGSGRLVVVLDGVLESLAFAALPDPADETRCPRARPLLARHEIVHLPSVGVLAAQRRRVAGRRPAPRGVAVVADPVYRADDPRLQGRKPTSGRGPARLVHSGREAEAILDLAPDSAHAVLGFDASKAAILDGTLAGYGLLHFAVHGVLHPEQPLLSRLELSRFDRRGEATEGSLYAHEIYDLDLPAELVVLSACDTARGRWIPGEGVVAGLPRAFLYAGAERVLVSLWALPDRTTGELMEDFYERLLVGRLSPGRALQEAQRELWKAGRSPREWAAFQLQGDWRPLPPFER